MKQTKNQDRIFIISEDSYDETIDSIASLYSMLNILIHMAQQADALAKEGKGVKRHNKRFLKRCDEYAALSALLLKQADIPLGYIASRNKTELEAKKMQELFVDDDILGEDAAADVDYTDDDYDFDFDEVDEAAHEPTYMDMEHVCDAVQNVLDSAGECLDKTSEVLDTTEELMEALEEIKYRMSY